MENRKITSYKELEIWKLSKKIAVDIFSVTQNFPKSQVFVMASQMQRAAISIPSNIAEGRSRNSLKEFIQFLHIAQGSKAELETQIFISQDVGLLNKGEAENILGNLDILGKMLNKMIISLKAKSNKQ